jgi:hypothetical protein
MPTLVFMILAGGSCLVKRSGAWITSPTIRHTNQHQQHQYQPLLVHRRPRSIPASISSFTTPTRSFSLATTTTTQHMTLIPLPVEDLEQLLETNVKSPSGGQYAAYWGRTKRERYNRLLESSIVGVVGVLFSYCLSFVLGGFVATIFGTLFAFWAILSPDFKARQRNWEFLGGRPLIDPWIVDDEDETTQGLYGSLFLGTVKDVCVVEDTITPEEYELDDFQDYSAEDDELEQIAGMPYLLRMRVGDDEQRELQVHARLSEEYLGIVEGMPVAAILLSKSQTFSSLAALTDIYVPDENCFVGDYPYLNRVEMEAFIAEDDEIWDLLQYQVADCESSNNDNDDYNSDDADYDDRDRRDRSKVVVRQRRR